MCHLIQNRSLEFEFFELILYLPGLEPITEDRFEAEDCRLSSSPTMVMTLLLPLLAPDFPDPPQISSRVWRSVLRLAWRQILAPFRGGIAALAPCRLSVS